MSKTSIIKGTLILTAAGIITRILGFFYRIILSKELGPELLGVYQLIFPIYGICFTLYASGIQIALAQLIAGSRNNRRKTLIYGMIFSLIISLSLTIFFQTNSLFVAQAVFQEPRLAPLLRILSAVFPFCGITACINGYFIGLQNAKIPAITQIIEQLGRIALVIIIGYIFGQGSLVITCNIAVIGLIGGELISNLYNILQFRRQIKFNKKLNSYSSDDHPVIKRLFLLAAPISGTRFLTALLHSLEAVLIPFMLRSFGFSTAMALSTYGIVTGMVMPFILFPGSITNSMSTMLLPKIASDSQSEKKQSLTFTIETGLKYSVLIGIFSWTVFLTFGQELGMLIYQSAEAGKYLLFLSAICPLLYVSTTAAGVLNGLGKTHITFFTTISGLAIRILFLVFLTPHYGIYAYFFGLLIGQFVNTAFDLYFLHKNVKFHMDLFGLFTVPLLFMFGFVFILDKLQPYVSQYPTYIVLPAQMLVTLLVFIGFGIKSKLISMNS